MLDKEKTNCSAFSTYFFPHLFLFSLLPARLVLCSQVALLSNLPLAGRVPVTLDLQCIPSPEHMIVPANKSLVRRLTCVTICTVHPSCVISADKHNHIFLSHLLNISVYLFICIYTFGIILLSPMPSAFSLANMPLPPR